jgi:hypothetical protein
MIGPVGRVSQQYGASMQAKSSAKVLGAFILLASLPAPLAAQAQGTIQGAERGARQGERDAGPVGAVMPETGVTYSDVPADYHVTGYRYTYDNDHAVLVDPRTRQVVQIID